MYGGKTIKLGAVIWKVMKHALASDLTQDEAASYALEYIRLMGAPVIYLDKITEPIELKYYKARTPDNMLWVKGVKYIADICDANVPNAEIAMIKATDVYHSGSQMYDSTNPNYRRQDQGFTYIIEKGIIKTSIENGYVIISYKGLALDEFGYPLIPDKEEFILGLEYYMLHRYMEPLWMVGKIPDKVFSYIEQKRHFYFASAHTGLNMPDADKMESIMNGINRLIPNTTGHRDFFRNYGVREQIKKYH